MLRSTSLLNRVQWSDLSMQKITKPITKHCLSSHDSFYSLYLLGKPLTGGGATQLIAGGATIAYLLADEWKHRRYDKPSLSSTIDKHTMPVTSLTMLSMDIAENDFSRNGTIEKLVQYCRTDTLCYMVADPPKLCKRQHETWNPILEQLEKHFSCPINKSLGFGRLEQPSVLLEKLKQHLLKLNSQELAGFLCTTEAAKSVLLSFALLLKMLSVNEALDASLLESRFQIEQWGEMPLHHSFEEACVARMMNLGYVFMHC